MHACRSTLEDPTNRWGAESTSQLVDANNRRPELYLTPAGVDARAAVEMLETAGIAAEPVLNFPESVHVAPPGTPREALAAVPAVVQDPAAAMVVRYADFPAGSTVIDLSAAPGGKTIGLAREGRFVIGVDVSLARLRRTRTNIDRTGVGGSVALAVADGREPPFIASDAILLDAPCSGTGTLRRHADGRWRLDQADLGVLARLQRELLDAAATLVRPGGLLVYATCSLEPEENEEQVQSFLGRHPGFQPVAPGTAIDGTMLAGPFLTILPQVHGVDGAFAARLMRID